MVRWLRWHCPPDTGFEIRVLAVWGRARYLSVTEAPHNTNFHTWMGKNHFCFFQTAETGNRTPNSGVKGSGANHYPRAPAQIEIGKQCNRITTSWPVLRRFSTDRPWFKKETWKNRQGNIKYRHTPIHIFCHIPLRWALTPRGGGVSGGRKINPLNEMPQDSHRRHPANTRRESNAGSMLDQRRRRWPNIEPGLVYVSPADIRFKWNAGSMLGLRENKMIDPHVILAMPFNFYHRNTQFLAPAVTVGERRELWILPPFFFGLFFCL